MNLARKLHIYTRNPDGMEFEGCGCLQVKSIIIHHRRPSHESLVVIVAVGQKDNVVEISVNWQRTRPNREHSGVCTKSVDEGWTTVEKV